MKHFLIGAAVIALAATGAQAGPDKGNGKDHKGKAQVSAKAKVGNKSNVKAKAKVERRDTVRVSRADDRKDYRRSDSKDNKQDNKAPKRAKSDDRKNNDRSYDTRRSDDRSDVRRTDYRQDRRETRRDDDRRAPRYVDRVAYESQRDFMRRDRSRVYINGCPPGLAKKGNGCTPPGLAKRARTNMQMFRYDYRPRLFGLTNYSSGRYTYNNGYLLRMNDRGSVAGYIPLLGGALAVGNQWPNSYQSYEVPNYYVDYYNLGGTNNYRYADDVIYRVDPQDSAIVSIAALLTGDDINIGQPMPRGYDVYNVPYSYRDRYYDTPEANYRYSDGYVYRIDPTTQLVAAAIDLLV
ncbi:hypothetical protein [Qipengyuania marisflavi]|uniref:RcnB family protein n=1 Tax=Qipengyuania marisflavi TaxID=2486356 RepID=A0A5S3PC13_9SPHN|nr:hypothetical protein [Qipengyuania marisflavi]TMM48779.1 hypothetical protein FEV51_05120 [Qipengyuania marisflavi]